MVAADGAVLVVESAAHRLVRLAPGALSAAGATTVAANGTAPSGRRASWRPGR